jgi:hypothetical protein
MTTLAWSAVGLERGIRSCPLLFRFCPLLLCAEGGCCGVDGWSGVDEFWVVEAAGARRCL